MSLLRLIARLDIKGPNVVKGVQMEGLRVVGKPQELAKRYAEEADELLYIDTVASLYGRNQLSTLLESTTAEVFIPVTVGGGIKSNADIRRLLGAGADKVAINTAAVRSPSLINECADHYGSQAIVVSVEAKASGAGWEAYIDNGREKTGLDAIRWTHEAVERGAGEILVTSVDRDGTKNGFDTNLIRSIGKLPVPLSVCGGMGRVEHALEALDAGASAIVMASALHYNHVTFKEMHDVLKREFAKGKFRHAGLGRAGSEAR